MKLALGTAQFGLAYGIANETGQVSAAEACSILRLAQSVGIDTIDTAISYGESEQQLGEAGVGSWKVVSKLPGAPEGCHDIHSWVSDAVRGSLTRLRIPCLYGVLLHRPGQLLESDGTSIYGALLQLKAEGLAKKIGVSIYDPEELSALCGPYRFDIVQAPLSVLDRRLIQSGWLKRLVASGAEVHTRSVFLQGLLLIPSSRRPKKFDRWAALWADYDRWLDDTGLTPMQACLRDAMSIPDIAKVVVGVDSRGQLMANVRAAEGPAPSIPDWLGTADPDLLNPAHWPALA